MNTVISFLAITAITMADNVRLQSRYNLPPLLEDIRVNGLKTPISVYKKGDVFPTLQGHRRVSAMQLLKKTDTARFEELFGKGIPCIVQDISDPRDIARFKVDHGNELALSDPYEVQKCANMLFKVGFKELEVVVELHGLMERISPMKADRRKEIEAIEDKPKHDKALLDYRRGAVQNLHNAYRCPFIVMAALEHRATGEPVEGFEKKYLPKLSTSQVTKLWKAHKEDLAEVDEATGAAVFNSTRTGPKFRKAWEKCVVTSQKAEADKEEGVVREKAMSGKDMKIEITEGKWLSVFGQKITKHHTGDKSVGDLTPLDHICYHAEMVKAHDVKAWKALEKAFKAVEEKLIAEDAEKAKTEEVKAS